MTNPKRNDPSRPGRLAGRVLVALGLCAALAAVAAPWWTERFAPRAERIAAAPRAAVGQRAMPVTAPVRMRSDDIIPLTPARSAADGGIGTYTVVFTEQPVASYRGGTPGLAAPRRVKAAAAVGGERERLDVRSAEARGYAAYLDNRQRQMERQMSAGLGRAVQVRKRMQHAINAVIMDLSAAEAARIARMPGVRLVEAHRDLPQETDTGPAHIGAGALWNGTYFRATGAQQGEGMVIGVIDSGINFGSPSFAAVGPVDGHTHVNPLGAGNYLGTCQAGGVDEGRCNAKLIGGYDFVCNAPGNQCGVTDVREEPGFGDTNTHGSHVASIVAGNTRDATFAGGLRRISGVAPRAHIIAYDVCYTRISTGQGLCPSASSTAAINQAVADGIVDALNYSIGGGQSPWTESVSLAFLGATDAGIYVAASAGNSGPGPNTLSNMQPWVASSAAAQHGRGGFGVRMNVTGPGTVPANIATMTIVEGTGGTPHNAEIPGTTPLKISPGINAADDGCNSYPLGTFTGTIAVIRRGTCNFTVKAGNAAAVGAIAVVIANNQAGSVTPSVPGATIPVFSTTQVLGDALRDFGLANPTATARIAFPPVALSNTPDALASFSSRGPAGTLEILKPDATAPGVDILAVTAGATLTGFEQNVGFLSGTSMASPHHAGAVLLVRQARPSWTTQEVKSAMVMTATQQVFLEDQVTLAGPLARGGGRIRVDAAVNAGLVMHETTQNFTNANPGSGGNPSALNLPYLVDLNCTGTCTFQRTFRSTRTYGSLWRLTLTGGINGTISDPLIWVPTGATRTVTIQIDPSNFPVTGFATGNLEVVELFTAGVTNTPSLLRLPVVGALPPPPASAPTTSVPRTSSQPANLLQPRSASSAPVAAPRATAAPAVRANRDGGR